MYYQYFGLNEEPFSIAVNPRYLFMSPRHRDALAHLLYGVGSGGGFILLTGEVGTGKTTINRCLLEQLPDDTDIAMILNPALNAVELLATACDEFDIPYAREQQTLKSLTDPLHRFLLENHARGRKTVLLIDEAQHLDFDVLEQIRLLTNLETNSQKLLQIILIGQPELAQKLARPELRQLNQRITARYNLEALNLDETGAYIQHRLQVAGMNHDREIFPPSVVRGIHQATRGIPRVINVLCDRILMGAYGRNQSRADKAMLRLAIREVLGADAAADVADGWNWPVAVAAGLALVLVLVLAGGWFLMRPDANSVAASPATAEVSPDGVPAPAASAVDDLSQGSPEPSQARVRTEAVSQSLPAAPAPIVEVISDVILPPGEAMARLWWLYTDVMMAEATCAGPVRYGVRCTTGEAGTWDEIATLDRPLVLVLVTPQRFSAELLLLGIEGKMAWGWSPAGLKQISLADIAPLWTGQYRYVWHVPRGFSKSLVYGDNSTAVASVAQLFAELDAQPKPLTDTRFNRALQQRVRLFQRAHQLVDDGVVGVQTLLALNVQLGIDPNLAEARRRLQTPALSEVGAG